MTATAIGLHRVSLDTVDGGLHLRFVGRPTSASGFGIAAHYLPFGPLLEPTFANGTKQRFEHDDRYRITKNELIGSGGGGSLASYTYDYAAAANVLSIDRE